MPTLPAGITLGAPSPTRGRSVLAARPFGPGDTVATFAGPCVTIPETSHLARTCSHCLAVATAGAGLGSALSSGGSGSSSGKGMRACQGCKTSRYCGAACQKADWALVHGRGECKAMRRARLFTETVGPPSVLPTPVRALIQVLVRPEMVAAVAEMEGHAERSRSSPEPSNDWLDLQLQARGALHYVGRPESSPKDVAETVEIMCKLKVNSFNRRDVDLDESGVYIDSALAMINHSCVPNAFVEIVGRTAVLHAYRAIKEGEEIEISYIETTLPRSRRRQALKTQYHFDCVCPRCKDDLNVYQVCQRYPHLDLNSFSLTPDLDLDKFRNPPLDQLIQSNNPLQHSAEEIYPSCSAPLTGSNPSSKHIHLRQRWKTCAPLVKAQAYAVDPLTQVLVEASIYFGGEQVGKLAYGLAISCFVALRSDAYRDPMPFSAVRIKGMFMIGKFLAHTATAAATSSTSGGNGGRALAAKVSQALGNMDQLTMGQTILKLIIHHSAVAHSKEWQVYQQANDLLSGLESLPGRETENALVDAFVRNPSGSDEMAFFKNAVLKPLQTLAGFTLEIMDAEFGM